MPDSALPDKLTPLNRGQAYSVYNLSGTKTFQAQDSLKVVKTSMVQELLGSMQRVMPLSNASCRCEEVEQLENVTEKCHVICSKSLQLLKATWFRDKTDTL